MTHVVRFAFHGFGIHVWQSTMTRLGAQDFLGERSLVVWIVLGKGFRLFRLGLHKHLPESFRFQIIDSHVGGGIAENVWHRLLELLDGDSKAICFIGLFHCNEWIAIAS